MKHTQSIMTLNAVLLGILGLLLSFLPLEVSGRLYLNNPPEIMLQLWGAALLGYAMLNWTSRGSILGGIYGKAISLGNFMHYFVGAAALIKLTNAHADNIGLVLLSIFYILFAIIFSFIAFRHPKAIKKTSGKGSSTVV